MSHFHCRSCDRSAEFATTSAAKTDGWRDLTTEGSAGPVSGIEYLATCPDC
jgi:hypothetical protein